MDLKIGDIRKWDNMTGLIGVIITTHKIYYEIVTLDGEVCRVFKNWHCSSVKLLPEERKVLESIGNKYKRLGVINQTLEDLKKEKSDLEYDLKDSYKALAELKTKRENKGKSGTEIWCESIRKLIEEGYF